MIYENPLLQFNLKLLHYAGLLVQQGKWTKYFKYFSLSIAICMNIFGWIYFYDTFFNYGLKSLALDVFFVFGLFYLIVRCLAMDKNIHKFEDLMKEVDVIYINCIVNKI